MEAAKMQKARDPEVTAPSTAHIQVLTERSV